MPKIAVCMAAFNGTPWLAEQLNSVFAQTGVLVSIFVSVDQSTDGTEEWFDQRAKDDSRIILLPHGKRFGGAARNFLRIIHEVDFSDFDYVCFADQDDIWMPGKLARAHEVISTLGVDAYSSNVIAFWPDGRKKLIWKSQTQTRWDFLFEAAGPGCTYVIRRELACAIQKLVRERWLDVQNVGLHDWFLYAFARANGYRWVIDSSNGMLYRQHASNQVGVNSGPAAFLHRMRKVLNGWGLRQSALIAELVGLRDNPFVRHWSGGDRLGLLWLAMHARQCRRRTRDKLVFALSCLALSMTRRPGQ
ncbi:MAG: glycosyl transferase [Burkholderiales bacterium]|nr:MAG: glycosyl transferase [Burkholderiales bacterium]